MRACATMPTFGLTQKQAAALCGVEETTVQRWEGGQTKKVRGIYLDRLREAEA